MMFKLWFEDLCYEHSDNWNNETAFMVSYLNDGLDLKFCQETYIRRYPFKEIKRYIEWEDKKEE